MPAGLYQPNTQRQATTERHLRGETLLGLFEQADAALAAADSLKQRGVAVRELLSPVPVPGAERVFGPKKPVIRYFTFFGALGGFVGGFLLAAVTAALYPHPAGGRATIAFPPYLVIGYELAILCGVLGTLLGLLLTARLPALRDRPYAPEASVDRFTLVIDCRSQAERLTVMRLLREAGAEAIRTEREGP